jgi:DNA-binding GntR family transcriptional regulator
MTVNGALERSVLADQVKDRLLQAIVRGDYPPDARIVETQVARELGTSQAPVREALRGLEALGVVELTPFRGARVRRPSRAEILEVYAVRAALETLAGRLAVPRMTDADVDGLRDLLEAMRAAARADDGHAVAEADAAFHGRIVALAGNTTLDRVWRSLQPFSRTWLTLAVPGADPTWAAELHAAIADALDARDPDAVDDAVRGHFEQVAEDMARRWPSRDGDADATTPPVRATAGAGAR